MGLTDGEFRDELSGGEGVLQIGTTIVTTINWSLLKFHEDTTLTALYVNGGSTDVRETYHLQGAGSTFKQGAIIKPYKKLGHRFFSTVNINAGSAEGVVSDKKK